MTFQPPSLAIVQRDETLPPRAAPAATGAVYGAQIFGQPGVKRGLRGGEAVLKAARTAYLEAEFSGEHDRRPPPGLLRRTSL